MAREKTTPEDAFHVRYAIDRVTGCWIWTGDRDKDGYGLWQLKKQPLGNGKYLRKRIRASRLSWQIYKGPIPDGMRVLHTCDNPPCVNPEHLFLGTPKQNSEDMSAKGRSPRGERQGKSVLKEADVIFIRNSDKTLDELAAQYGVSIQTISDARNGRTWSHITVPRRFPSSDNQFRRGERNGSAKLTTEIVIAIRSRMNESNASLAREYGVTDVLIGKVKRREIWTHIP